MSGELLGRYELLSLIGEGAMGTVYRAYDSNLERTVAIKVMSPDLGRGTEAVARFKREAVALAALKHPQIVTIHDFLAVSGNLCLVMELLEGAPLDKVIDTQKHADVPVSASNMTVQQKLAFMASVCRALDYAHSRGVIHRDLKPSNIIMTPDGTPKIVDFGIAKLANDDLTRLTRTHTRIGTIAYMSPEQFNGEPVDHRTDIFSAGVVLYELLSGISPFAGTHTTATMKKILIDPTPALPETLTGVPKGIQEILNKALAKDKDQRYETATQFAVALERCVLPINETVRPLSEPAPGIVRDAASPLPATNDNRADETNPAPEDGPLSPQNETSFILWTLASVALFIWLFAIFSQASSGAWVHLLFVFACTLILINLARRRLAAQAPNHQTNSKGG